MEGVIMRKICFISTILFLIALFAGCGSNNPGYYSGLDDSSMYNPPPDPAWKMPDFIVNPQIYEPPPPQMYIPPPPPPYIPPHTPY